MPGTETVDDLIDGIKRRIELGLADRDADAQWFSNHLRGMQRFVVEWEKRHPKEEERGAVAKQLRLTRLSAELDHNTLAFNTVLAEIGARADTADARVVKLEREKDEALAEWEAEREVMMNGARMICRFAKRYAELDHAKNPSHDTGEILNHIKHVESIPSRQTAVLWMNEMTARAESAESRVREFEAALAEAKRDAERYAWLKQAADDDENLALSRIISETLTEDWDSAIDRALAPKER